MGKVFISHSSNDNIVSLFTNFLTSIGIKNEDIFCSSMEGQGVKNGQRINEAVFKELKASSIVIYLMTNNFLKSIYCNQELGFSMALEGKRFIIKFEDVDDKDIKGFVDSSYKYNLFDTDGLSSLYDELADIYSLNNKMAVITRNINKLLVDAKNEIKVLVEDKDKSDEELEEKRLKILQSQYQNLSIGEKRIIGSIYYSEDAVGYYAVANGTISLLQTKAFVMRVTSVSRGLMQFAYALQPWVIEMIKNDKKIADELSSIVKKRENIDDDADGTFSW